MFPGRARGIGQSQDPDLLRIYLDQADQYPLLNRSQEVTLGEQVQRGQQHAEGLAVINALRAALVIQPIEATPQVTKVIQEGETAKETFILANLRLVVSHAKIYVRGYEEQGRSKLDCVQDGNVGLMTAVGKFDPRKGFRFAAYGSWWIRSEMQRGLREVSNSATALRLNAPIQTGTDSGRQVELGDTIADRETSTAHDRLINNASHVHIVEVLLNQSGLSGTERDLIETAYLSDCDSQTIRANLKAKGLTGDNRRRLESVAFRKIRSRALELGISDPLFG